jgi:YebC/PmpR family DNA-binding regulatory protein
MSGHNKWSKIKNKKAVTDAQKSKIFGKLVRFVAVESKKAKGDVNSPGLRAAIEKAKEANVPSDNIERAIKKGQGGEGGEMEQITYEAYGPGGCALIIEALTENRNKAAQEIKHILSENGFELATPGSAAWAFEKAQGTNEWTPKNTLPVSEEDSEKLEKLIGELEENDEVQEVFTNAE